MKYKPFFSTYLKVGIYLKERDVLRFREEIREENII